MEKCGKCGKIAKYKIYNTSEFYCEECAKEYLKVLNQIKKYGFAEIYEQLDNERGDKVSIINNVTGETKIVSKEEYFKNLRYVG